MAWHPRRKRIPPQRPADRSRRGIQRACEPRVCGDAALGDLAEGVVDALWGA